MEQREILDEIAAERRRQDAKWGGPLHDDGHSLAEWQELIVAHAARASAEPFELAGYYGHARVQLVRVAALAVAAIEAYDRQTDGGTAR